MSARRVAYPTYRDSGLDWLGDVPEHWATGVKLLNLAESSRGSFVNGPFGSDLLANELGDEGVPVVYIRDLNVGGYYRKSAVCVTAIKARELDFCRVAPGDVLVAKVGDPPGDACVYPAGADAAIVTQDVIRIRIEKSRVHPFYLACVLNTAYGRAVVENISVESTRKRVSLGDFKKIRLALPPVAEQTQIAKFLDYETAKIDALIEKQQQLIALLQEKRQAVISHAVTKGLNPDAPMRDSGVEWLGKVPAHWEVKRAKHVACVFVPQRNKPELNDSDGVAWITMDDMHTDEITNGRLYVSSEAARNAGSKILEKGAVIASCVGNFGACAINRIDVVINQQLQAYVPFGIAPSYLAALVELSVPYFEMVGTAATLVYVNQRGFDEMPVVVPPPDEQLGICEAVATAKSSFDSTMRRVTDGIDLLQERRTALISAAVTGKIDVRGWKPPASDADAEVA